MQLKTGLNMQVDFPIEYRAQLLPNCHIKAAVQVLCLKLKSYFKVSVCLMHNFSPEALAACQWRSDWPLCRGPPDLPACRRPTPADGWRWLLEHGT